MITETTRDRLGWGDFEGFVYLKDDTPAVQLFESATGEKTIFWRGRAQLPELLKTLPSATREIDQFVNKPAADFTRFTCRYVVHNEITSLDLNLAPRTSEARAARKKHDEFVRSNIDELVFARFDLVTEFSRLSVWSDLTRGSSRGEVGVTAPIIIESIFPLIRSSSLLAFSDNELSQLAKLLQLHSNLVEA